MMRTAHLHPDREARNMNATLLKRMVALRGVPPQIVLLTAATSYIGIAVANLEAWPLWAIALGGLLPWLPIFFIETVWTYRHYSMLAVFYVLLITLLGHMSEHVAQMIQIHFLNLSGADARGIFGALDIEWVHFIFNTWILVAEIVLLRYFRQNPWLWAGVVIATWHGLEHAEIMWVYLTTGVVGTPGLLAQGGLIGGGLPVTRPDLHFFYNVVETVPIIAGFAYQLRRSYDEWLARAFPRLPAHLLIEATERLEPRSFPAGAAVVRQGDIADRLYIVTRGEAEVTQLDPHGGERHVRDLVPGQYFGEIGLLAGSARTATVRARTDVEVLAIDQQTLGTLLARSQATADDLQRTVRARLASSAESP